jgi:hypothetical protein
VTLADAAILRTQVLAAPQKEKLTSGAIAASFLTPMSERPTKQISISELRRRELIKQSALKIELS